MGEHENASENAPGEDTAEVFISSSNENINVVKAKKEELDNWKNFKVYEEVKDNGQSAISVTWVCTEKKKKTKARLVARGYEEKEKAQTDSEFFLSPFHPRDGNVSLLILKQHFYRGKIFI